LAEVIRASGTVAPPPVELSPLEQLVLTAVGYFQPVTRMQIADLLGKPVGRDTIAALRSFGLIATGPRSPEPGAPYTYVTTPASLELSSLASLRDLPDLDRLDEAGLAPRRVPRRPRHQRRRCRGRDGRQDHRGRRVPPGVIGGMSDIRRPAVARLLPC
jgi:segregation and condensation protein B